eukprot:3130535-Amphidinium_carterae.3
MWAAWKSPALVLCSSKCCSIPILCGQTVTALYGALHAHWVQQMGALCTLVRILLPENVITWADNMCVIAVHEVAAARYVM